MDRALRRHPALFGAVLGEEVHYFDLAYDRGPSWYRSHFPLRSCHTSVNRSLYS